MSKTDNSGFRKKSMGGNTPLNAPYRGLDKSQLISSQVLFSLTNFNKNT